MSMTKSRNLLWTTTEREYDKDIKQSNPMLNNTLLNECDANLTYGVQK